MILGLTNFMETMGSLQNPKIRSCRDWSDKTMTLAGNTVHIAWQPLGLLNNVAENSWPDVLNLQFVPITRKFSNDNNACLQSNEIVEVVVQITGTAFLKFYERNTSLIKLRFGTQPKKWPPLFLFAWHLRNAIAHGDRFSITDKTIPVVSWKGIEISSNDNNRHWFGINQFLGGADVVALMRDISDQLKRINLG
jgi:hypothetical protein